MASINQINNIIPDADFTVSNGDVILSAGNVQLPTTSSTVGQITINSVRFVHGYGTNNYWFGPSGNFTLTGTSNVFVGDGGNNLTTGLANSCVGQGAGAALTSGQYNALLGWGAGGNKQTGDACVAIGAQAQANTTAGSHNISLGYGSGYVLAGDYNISAGFNALSANTSGSYNVSLGVNSLISNVSGNYNLGLGFNAGSALTTSDSNNIYLMNVGVVGDNNKMRLGATGAGAAQVNNTFIAGIYNVTPASSTQEVVVVSDGDEMGSVPYAETTNFTPGLTFGGGSTGLTLSTAAGRYTRIGDMVNFTIQLSLSNVGSSTGIAQITGLPFSLAYRFAYSIVTQNVTYTNELAGLSSTSGTTLAIVNMVSGGAVTNLTETAFTNSSIIWASGTYQIA